MKLDNKSISERGIVIVLIMATVHSFGYYSTNMFAGLLVMFFSIQAFYRGMNGEGKYKKVFIVIGIVLFVLAFITARVGV